MLGGINIGSTINDAAVGAGGSLFLESVTDYFNLPVLSEPSLIGQGMNNAELLLSITGGLSLAGGLFSLVSKRKLIGGADKNLIGFGAGVLIGKMLYPSLVAPLIGQVPTI